MAERNMEKCTAKRDAGSGGAAKPAAQSVDVQRGRDATRRSGCGEAPLDDGLPAPDEVRAEFDRLRARGPELAVRYLHGLSLGSGYVGGYGARSIRWTGDSPCGELECSINLAKPEKDPRDIAAAAHEDGTPTAGEAAGRGPGAPVPRCELCWENEGFPGSPGHPAKPGLRIAYVELGGERWGLFYSPYAYFEEHCIVASEEHRPMRIDGACLERLLGFVDAFPFYFLGSNADLPLVGGSILSHDHFQGGRHVFPLMKAPIERDFPLEGFPGVEAGVVRWPASTVRLAGKDRAHVAKAAAHILQTWREFSFEPCGVRPSSELPDGAREQHSTITPVARKESGAYILDLVLRNNRADEQHPWGIFHPGEELHHLKKENIGLIEIMGLAIFPARLANELPQVQDALVRAARENDAPDLLEARLREDPAAAPHAAWAADVYARRAEELRAPWAGDGAGPVDGGGILHPVVADELTAAFASILETTGVFKRDAAGSAGWDAFAQAVSGKTRAQASKAPAAATTQPRPA